MTDDHQMTRREYREQQAHHPGKDAQALSEGRPSLQVDQGQEDANLDQEPLIKRPIPDSEERRSPEEEPLTREQSLANDKAAIVEEKTQHLKSRLNRVIFGLIGAIIIVYLILFFVG